MLILTRNISEQIVIGDDIKIAILGISGKQVRLGIEAPRHVNIVRTELLEREKNGQGNKQSNFNR